MCRCCAAPRRWLMLELKILPKELKVHTVWARWLGRNEKGISSMRGRSEIDVLITSVLHSSRGISVAFVLFCLSLSIAFKAPVAFTSFYRQPSFYFPVPSRKHARCQISSCLPAGWPGIRTWRRHHDQGSERGEYAWPIRSVYTNSLFIR